LTIVATNRLKVARIARPTSARDPLKYISTRGGESLKLAELLTRGTAADGGLFVPERWPSINQFQLDKLLEGEYAEIAGRVLEHFGGLAGNITHTAVRTAMQRFAEPVGPPVTPIKAGLWSLELMHGPTLAFKDFALSPLAEFIDQTLELENRQATVLCATSGDTGAATVSAFANRENLRAVVLFPEGGVSEFQRMQMTTTGAANVLALSVAADFDTCQSIVKKLYQTPAAKQYGYTAVNSINLLRILLQSAYYLRTSGLLQSKTGKTSNFIVPTGNFGNVYAAYIAKQLGAPIGKLIVTSNDNDVLPRFFDSSVMEGKETVKTISPSMDIQVSSNFERLLWHVKNNDGQAVNEAQKALETSNRYQLNESEMQSLRQHFSAMRCVETEATAAIRFVHNEFNKIVCPHTATAFHAYLSMNQNPQTETVIVETAHPIKFSDAVEKAINVTLETPAQVKGLFERQETMVSTKAELSEIQNVISSFLEA